MKALSKENECKFYYSTKDRSHAVVLMPENNRQGIGKGITENFPHILQYQRKDIIRRKIETQNYQYLISRKQQFHYSFLHPSKKKDYFDFQIFVKSEKDDYKSNSIIGYKNKIANDFTFSIGVEETKE